MLVHDEAAVTVDMCHRDAERKLELAYFRARVRSGDWRLDHRQREEANREADEIMAALKLARGWE